MKRYAALLYAAVLLSTVVGYAPSVLAVGAYGADGADPATHGGEPRARALVRVRAEAVPRAAELGAAWAAMTPAEQRLLRRFASEWSSLRPERRDSLLRGARRWLAATPAERHRWREFFHRWRSLSPEEREQLRERWQSLSAEERERLQDWLRFGRPPGGKHFRGRQHPPGQHPNPDRLRAPPEASGAAPSSSPPPPPPPPAAAEDA